MLTLYFSPGSSSMAAHIALHEVGAEFESKSVSLAKKETHTPEFLAVNPEGKVPTLVIDGRVLTEVAGILFYLAKRFPQAHLLPEGDIEAEAQVVSWMSFIASTIHPARRLGLDHARAVYKLADRRLGTHDWTVGDRYSIADIHLFRLFWRFRGTLNPQPSDFPNIERHYERMMTRPAVQKTIEIESKIGYLLPA
jgi:glutathione S-transferase